MINAQKPLLRHFATAQRIVTMHAARCSPTGPSGAEPGDDDDRSLHAPKMYKYPTSAFMILGVFRWYF